MSWLPRISMGLTIAQLSERLRCAECGGQLHSVKPWRMEASRSVGVADLRRDDRTPSRGLDLHSSSGEPLLKSGCKRRGRSP
jgi:ribosomal protein L34E